MRAAIQTGVSDANRHEQRPKAEQKRIATRGHDTTLCPQRKAPQSGRARAAVTRKIEDAQLSGGQERDDGNDEEGGNACHQNVRTADLGSCVYIPTRRRPKLAKDGLACALTAAAASFPDRGTTEFMAACVRCFRFTVSWLARHVCVVIGPAGDEGTSTPSPGLMSPSFVANHSHVGRG